MDEYDEFIMLEGPKALTGIGYVQQSYSGLKEKLIADGSLLPRDGLAGTHKLRFAMRWPSIALLLQPRSCWIVTAMG